MREVDDGARCEEHTGEVFRPRCAQCDALGGVELDDWDPLLLAS